MFGGSFFGALTHHGPLDDDIAVINGECDARLVQDDGVFAFQQRNGVGVSSMTRP